MSEKFTPKQGEMIQVSEKDDFSDCSFLRNNGEREFICFTKNNEYYVVHTVKGTGVAKYEFARPIDKHKELEECIALGANIERKVFMGGCATRWFDYEGDLEDGRRYRIKGGISTDAFKKHYKTIIAYWSGAYVQCRICDEWKTLKSDCVEFITENEYKPYLPKGSIIEVCCDAATRVVYVTGNVYENSIEVYNFGCYGGTTSSIFSGETFKVIKYADEN